MAELKDALPYYVDRNGLLVFKQNKQGYSTFNYLNETPHYGNVGESVVYGLRLDFENKTYKKG